MCAFILDTARHIYRWYVLHLCLPAPSPPENPCILACGNSAVLLEALATWKPWYYVVYTPLWQWYLAVAASVQRAKITVSIRVTQDLPLVAVGLDTVGWTLQG